MDESKEETICHQEEATHRFKYAGLKMVKYGSFDSATTKMKRLRVSNSCHSWQSYPSSGIKMNTGAYFSPSGSSNTVTGTMYTASEGVRTSASGMTSFSDSVFDGSFLTPIGGSKTSFERMTEKNNSYHSEFGSTDEFDLEKENALNEEKLKDIKLQKDTSKDSIKRKIFNGISNRNKRKSKFKSSKENLLEQTSNERKSDKPPRRSVPGILKKSVSSDSGKIPSKQRDNKVEMQPILGGTKALLVQKVSAIFSICEHYVNTPMQ